MFSFCDVRSLAVCLLIQKSPLLEKRLAARATYPMGVTIHAEYLRPITVAASTHYHDGNDDNDVHRCCRGADPSLYIFLLWIQSIIDIFHFWHRIKDLEILHKRCDFQPRGVEQSENH